VVDAVLVAEDLTVVEDDGSEGHGNRVQGAGNRE
jgi:hypothetical protein